MRVIDPGHVFLLDHLSKDPQKETTDVSMLHFVKRVGPKYPETPASPTRVQLPRRSYGR